MSRNSKAKRDQRKKKQPKRSIQRLGQPQPIENHAVLQDGEGRVVAAIGLQGNEWLLAIGGQTMGNADTPIPMLAMLRHLSDLQAKEGKTVTLEYSDELRQMIADLAESEGQTPEAYLEQLVAEFQSNQLGEEDEAPRTADDAVAADTADNTDDSKPSTADA
jgi:predicted transcriptional regulator